MSKLPTELYDSDAEDYVPEDEYLDDVLSPDEQESEEEEDENISQSIIEDLGPEEEVVESEGEEIEVKPLTGEALAVDLIQNYSLGEKFWTVNTRMRQSTTETLGFYNLRRGLYDQYLQINGSKPLSIMQASAHAGIETFNLRYE